MKTTKTTLQKIMEQKTDQIRKAIELAVEEAISNKGENINIKPEYNIIRIDGIYIHKDKNDFRMFVQFESQKLAKLLQPSEEELRKQAEQKRAELQEIENQLKERAKS